MERIKKQNAHHLPQEERAISVPIVYRQILHRTTRSGSIRLPIKNLRRCKYHDIFSFEINKKLSTVYGLPLERFAGTSVGNFNLHIAFLKNEFSLKDRNNDFRLM